MPNNLWLGRLHCEINKFHLKLNSSIIFHFLRTWYCLLCVHPVIDIPVFISLFVSSIKHVESIHATYSICID